MVLYIRLHVFYTIGKHILHCAVTSIIPEIPRSRKVNGVVSAAQHYVIKRCPISPNLCFLFSTDKLTKLLKRSKQTHVITAKGFTGFCTLIHPPHYCLGINVASRFNRCFQIYAGIKLFSQSIRSEFDRADCNYRCVGLS